MEEKINQFIQKHQLFYRDSTIVVGVSGGPDSLALLHFLWRYKEREGWNIIVAHVDHMFRGKQSEEEMEFVSAYCQEIGVACETTQIDVSQYQKEEGLSSQTAARECRYAFFEQVMEKYNATHLALAQHGDDQVETILMRLVRGAAFKSVAGIQSKRSFGNGYVVRPFLSVSKEEIVSYCAKHKLQPRFDPSNDMETYTRNRFRKNVLPFLRKENPNVHALFQRFSEKQLEDELLLEELTKEKMNTVIKRKSKRQVEISLKALGHLPIPLQRRGLQLILNYLYHTLPSSLSSIHIEQIFKLISAGSPSGSLHLPRGLIVKRSYDNCMFTFIEEKVYTYTYHLMNGDKVVLPNGSEIWTETTSSYPRVVDHHLFILNSGIQFPLTIRSRNQGDRIQLKGMNGSKKIKDIFIDEKIPVHERNSWPIVENKEGQVLWLPGLKKSKYEAVDNQKESYTVLHYKGMNF
jgi:tRNA(Ile)-lysidine synthase